jgi:osmotically-inducible protein OsmY
MTFIKTRTIAGILALASLSTWSIGQTTRHPSTIADQQILQQVKTIFHNEHAFDGMSISPIVSHGVVSLNGTVSSQAAKVLASTEIADV